ncbi:MULTISPECIES: ComEC/Rec2 family competence protein [Rhizobium]|jgi:hypothetical protein|uniref:hypothetical protein n=1 Tax=Rhizobium TaxID=379 RepID=UPI0010314063|nr:hypothetical protein [Rhizobium ruizarguesonis]TAZ86957.1 hypothetical protein ELH67_33220 [Rhizobium ruizarguesonis]TBA31945.1 hypothetical protein ELH60_25795 [Rhizobium ruizarguesonis]TBA50956.1 hypothetical protein ELH59_31925 [Rhizobium ruizarguesonis]TBA95546.1 hypothetical protein ELH55_29865 [Rhizobium ruizarguesonis]TBB36608.1 hypothetical protein ELH46_32405 [Rhizobium ruizarguesonis]
MAIKPKAKTATDAAAHMKPPPGGAIVRMYRIGHGDCFLIAFDGATRERPAYMLIDCGYKPGSPDKMTSPTRVKDIGADIIATTEGFVDVAVVTHEHQDHVNGLSATNFPGLKVGKVWFAWTENPEDDVANQLRKKFKDRLLGLLDARASLLGAGKTDAGETVDWYLQLELGEDPTEFDGITYRSAAAKDPAKSVNKLAMKFVRDCGSGDPDYLYPHAKPLAIPGARHARAFVLGPPHDIDKIDDLDPAGDENFGNDDHAIAAAALAAGGGTAKVSPFPRRHVIPLGEAFTSSYHSPFFLGHYGNAVVVDVEDGAEAPANAVWRRMSKDDAGDAGALALAMNNATNNASIVLAFELSKGGKVLLFAGDAQAGNWRSWSDADFDDAGTKITTKDLLSRTVLYKVGHHGSHNATLNGTFDSERPNLAWLGQGESAQEFAAMITAVEAWAHQKPKPDWNHPLPAIKQALLEKTGGRVFQTDTSLQQIKPIGSGASTWQSFLGRVKETDLCFDLTVEG